MLHKFLAVKLFVNCWVSISLSFFPFLNILLACVLDEDKVTCALGGVNQVWVGLISFIKVEEPEEATLFLQKQWEDTKDRAIVPP